MSDLGEGGLAAGDGALGDRFVVQLLLVLLMGEREAHGDCAERRDQHGDAEDEQRTGQVADPLEQESSRHGADISTRANDAGDTAQRLAIDERYEGIGRAAGHVGEQTEGEHGDDGERDRPRIGESEKAETLADHQHEQEQGAAIETLSTCNPVRRDAAERTGEESEKSEAAGCHSGLGQVEAESFDVIRRRYRMDEDLDAENRRRR